jgi:uncharacterized protein YndB with AHSA1/START domain
VVIRRPLEEVFGFLSDPENWTLWQPDLRESAQFSGGSIEAGATFRQALDLQGRQVELLCELTEHEPNERLSFACDREDVTLAFALVFEPVEYGTMLTGRGEGELNGFYGLFEPLVDREANEQVKANLHNLKDYLESRSLDA